MIQTSDFEFETPVSCLPTLIFLTWKERQEYLLYRNPSQSLLHVLSRKDPNIHKDNNEKQIYLFILLMQELIRVML
jgi:hypothetical protein